MASTVKVALLGDARSLNKAFDSAGAHARKFDRQASRTRRAAGVAFKAIGLGAVAGGALVVKGLKDSIDAAIEAQQVQAQTNAVLKSTGGVAKVSGKHISDLAERISQFTGIDDEAIQSTENLLLTFTKIRNETGKGNKIFDQATLAVTDMSVALKQDAKSSAIQLGKALNDPVKGITSLRRVGVAFTQDQVDLIKKLEATGHHLEAQRIILREVKSEFGGSARAAGKTFGGQINLLKVNIENLEERIGKLLLPTLNRWARRINAWLGNARNQRTVINHIRRGAKLLADVMRTVARWTQRAAVVARRFSNAVGGWQNALKIVLSGLLVAKLIKVFRVIHRIRKEMLLMQSLKTGPLLGPGGGVMAPGGRTAGKGGLKAGLKAGLKGAAAVAGAVAVHEAVKSLTKDPSMGADFSSGSIKGTVTSHGFAKGSPSYEAYMAGLRGASARSAHTSRKDPAYQKGVRDRQRREQHIHVNVDGREVAHAVNKHQARHDRKNSAQRAGRHGGRTR